MGVRKTIEIDEELCDGCGDCVTACHEGAIQIIDMKAKVVNDSYCDGLGDCIGECPQGAITIIEREAIDFDEVAVEQHLVQLRQGAPATQIIGRGPVAKGEDTAPCGCPSTAMQYLTPPAAAARGGCPGSAVRQMNAPAQAGAGARQSAPAPTTNIISQPIMPSQLGHWPVQLMLVPPHAPFLKGADLLICADCVPFTVPDFHFRYLTGRAIVVGCPKLDDLQHYYDKLKEMFLEAAPRSITVLRMEVPCCNGIAQAAVQARNEVAPHIPLEVETIGVQGGILGRKTPCESPA